MNHTTHSIQRRATAQAHVDTPLGPLYLGFGHASRGFNSWYLFLGRP